MKSFLNRIYDIFDSMNRARAAAHFSRMGRHDLAKQILLKD
jgi:hypothetical protein